MAPKRASSPGPGLKKDKGGAAPPRPPGDKKEKGGTARSSPAPQRKGTSSAPPARSIGGSRNGSEDNLADLDDQSPGTPLNSGSRVHAWVKLAMGAATGVDAEDTVAVKYEPVSGDEGVVVYASDGLGRRVGSATVDGAIGAEQPVRAAEGDLLAPLVDHVVDEPSLKTASLLCYGEDGAGRGESLFGSDSLVQAAVDRMLRSTASGSKVCLSATLVTMELLIDLFKANTNPTINETQFSGLHVDGIEWKEVRSPSEVTPGLVGQITEERDRIMGGYQMGKSARCVTIVALRYTPSDDTSWGNTLYMVELASPPLSKASGVPGLALDDYCSVNTSLKTLTKCLTAMGSKKKAATPPLRDSRLTHLLGQALGDDTSLIHCLVYVPVRRAKRSEAVTAINWAGKATAARLKKGVYAAASSKAMVATLQGVVAALDEPSAEMESEMREQMEPSKTAMEELQAAVSGKRAMLSEVEEEVHAQKAKVTEQLSKNKTAKAGREGEQNEIKQAIADLKDQVAGVRSGEKLNEAMGTLRKTIEEEKVALRKQLAEMEGRLSDAKSKLSGLTEANTKIDSGAPPQCEQLLAKGQAYTKAGKFKYASLMFMSAVKLMESIGLGRSKYVVAPVSSLADLYSAEGMDEEAIALYKQAYSIEKDASGADSPLLAKHLQKLGGAYEKQGKMEAATLTLEEAGSVLEHAHGPDHPEVQALREQLAALIEPEPDPEDEEDDDFEEEAMLPERAPADDQPAIEELAAPDATGAAPAEATGKKKPAAKKGKKGDAAAKDEAPAKGEKKAKKGAKGKGDKGDAAAPAGKKGAVAKPKAPALSRTGDDDAETVQKFSSQRMRARLEARQRRLAEEGRELSLGAAPPLPVMDDKSGDAAGGMSELLQKKRKMFKERMDRRRANEEAQEAIEASRAKRTGGGHDDDGEDEGEGEEEWDDEEDDDIEDFDNDDGGEEMALIESAVIEIIASSHSAAQKEDWAEVLDCSSRLEESLNRARGKVAACATAARVLLSTGLKHASGFTEEPRVRSTLGCLMLIEWCVPTCPDALRQAVASDRWVRKLVDLCRKDSTEQALVRTTVMQLMSNWRSWYGMQPACDGFEKACDMLEDEGFEIPPPARREDATSSGDLATSSGSSGGGPSGLGVPGLQLQLQLPLASIGQPFYVPQNDSSAKVSAELEIMREDVREIESALSKCDAGGAGKLGALELADAGQAATDCRGWQSRLATLLGTDADASQNTHRAENLSEKVLSDMRQLLSQIDDLLKRWQAAAPAERRGGRWSSEDGGDKENKMSALEAMQAGRIGDIQLPTLTPRQSGDKGGGAPSALGGGMTPRNPQLFLHNPKLLTARGPLAVPPDLQAQLSARGGVAGALSQRLASNRGGQMSNRGGQMGGMRPLSAQPGKGGMKPLSLGGASERGMGDASERKKVPGLPIPSPAEPMPHLDLAVPSSRRDMGAATKPEESAGAKKDAGSKEGDVFDDFLKPDRNSLSYLDLALPGGPGFNDGVPDFFASGFMDDSLGSFMNDPNQALDVQLAELSGLLGGDANAPQFLQEMLMLQMQAEAWRMQWSVAMQENEELRAKLYDTRNSLEAAGGGGASGEHWRELCISIAKSAEDEKGQILEQISVMRDDLGKVGGGVDERKEALDKLLQQAEEDRKAADEWSAKANDVIKARNELNAALYNADATNAETEADTEAAAMSMEDQKSKTQALEAEAEGLGQKLQEEELLYEQTLTEVYNAHREQVDALNLELTANEEDLQQGTAAMNQWRTQWEEELTEKNSIDAELLTLRSEFEKSSATYDREIEGLKELLEKERVLREEMATALQKEEEELGTHQQDIDKAKSEFDTLSSAGATDSKEAADAEKEMEEAKTQADADRAAFEKATGEASKAEGEIEAIKAASSGEQGAAAENIGTLRTELSTAEETAAKFADIDAKLEEIQKKKSATQAEIETLKSQTASLADSAVSEQQALQEALSAARSDAAKWEQEHSLQLAAKSTLLEEVNSLKLEAKELTDAHSREVERLNERLGQLERVHDTLDVTLAEEEAAFEGQIKQRREGFEAAIAQKEAAVAELVTQQEDVRAQLAEVRTLLTQEQREHTAAEENMKEVRESAEAKTADAEERERRLQAALSDMQAERARIEKEAAEEKSRFEQLIQTMGGEQNETSRKQKEAEERAIEFEKQWEAESKLRKVLHNELEEMVGNLRVYCRIRPASEKEKEGPLSIEVKGSDRVVVKDHDDDRKENKTFNFTQVYGPGTAQEDVFKDCESLMTSVLDGFNVCIFAYGQSGTGKTFTMDGNEEHPGLVPRAMSRIFEDVAARASKYQHDCYLSMIEIYNENIRDLLRDPKADASKVKFDIMRDNLVGMYVKDLTSEHIHTASHARSLIKQGNVNRATSSTGLNDQSSRSHMIVTLTVRTAAKLGGGDNYVGKLSLVDLAGSERLAKSQTTGQAQKETMAINKSLSALGTVIASLASAEKHVPYRDSKLTYLLQDSLGGNSKTLMFVNAGPAQANCAETINSLNFASRAKTVALGKATKNREDENGGGGGGGKAGKASTVMAAANKLGSDEPGAMPSARAGAPSADAPEKKEKKKLGAKAR